MVAPRGRGWRSPDTGSSHNVRTRKLVGVVWGLEGSWVGGWGWNGVGREFSPGGSSPRKEEYLK